MKNILVTGGCGFIGSHTVVELKNAGYNPIIIDNFSNSDPSVLKSLSKIVGGKVAFYEGDYQDKNLLEKIFNDEAIDGIIHFAAFKAVGESVGEPLKYYRNNVAGLITLLETMERAGINKIVFSSSCTVYGEPDTLPITEQAPTKPATSPYGATKQMCETILRDTCHSSDLRALALRYFNPIGAHPSGLIGELPIGTPQNLVPFVTQTAAGWREKLVVFGNDYDTPDGTNIRDYIHVVDLARAHVSALAFLDKQRPSTYDICNCGTGKGTSVLEVIKGFEKATGVKLNYEIGPRREGDVVKTYASVKRAKEMLGWEAEFTLLQALADAWRWQQTLKRPT